LNFRKKKFEAKLKRPDELAEWLAEHRRGTNFEIPENIDVIVPLVVSPFVEYIWSNSELLWLTSEIPRVCVPEELGSIANTDMLSQIVKKPFVHYIVKQ